MENAPFSIDINSVLNIISKDIYDSTYSLLRENVQNAYDAILERQIVDPSFSNPKIDIHLDGKELLVVDNGIGMDEQGLKEHYWTAGSSGKNTERARNAGVVGTFGIGAMANFGVCDYLEVTTKFVGTHDTIKSSLRKEEISLQKNCIKFEEVSPERENCGTTIRVVFSSTLSLNETGAIEYLRTYIRYLKVPVLFNGKLISQESYNLTNPNNSEQYFFNESRYDVGDIGFDYSVMLTKSTAVQPQIYLKNIIYLSRPIEGDIRLGGQYPELFGFRNGFGLAQMPIASSFNLGGIVNLITIKPTAGRDAINKESINLVSRIISSVDEILALSISKTEMAENSREFQQYLRTHGRYDLADNIQISIAGETNERITLGEIQPIVNNKKVYFYKGSDQTLLQSYIDKNNLVLVTANDPTRRNIQTQYLTNTNIPEISDSIQVLNIYEDKDLEYSEIAILYKIQTIICDQYFIQDIVVKFATISHNVSALVVKKDDLFVYLNRDSQEFQYLIDMYKSDFSTMEALVTDMVRSSLYPKFANYVPSSKKSGADAFYSLLQRRKELYTIESADLGDVDSLFADWVNGDTNINDLIKKVEINRKIQRQEVTPKSVGEVNEVIGAVVSDSVQIVGPQETQTDFSQAMPPILRLDKSTQYKILRTDDPSQHTNGYCTFLAISEKMHRDYRDFFFQPHTTRVIWSMHKIIYIFAPAAGGFTLYYDMDLDKPLNITGGKLILTSTIITKNKIYIPIVNDMSDYFNVRAGSVKFYVRYDTVRGKG